MTFFSSCLLDLTLVEGYWLVGVAHSSCLALLETVAKSQTASWHMAKACSAPRRGQLLMRTLMQLHQGGRGPGELGAGCQAPAPAGFSLAPSEPVSAGPQHLGRGARDQGSAGPARSVLEGMLSQRSWGAQGTGESGAPTWWQAPKAWQGGAGVQAAAPALFSLRAPSLGPPHPAQICLDLQEHTGGARHYLTAGLRLLAVLLGKEEQARAPCASFSCPCRF